MYLLMAHVTHNGFLVDRMRYVYCISIALIFLEWVSKLNQSYS